MAIPGSFPRYVRDRLECVVENTEILCKQLRDAKATPPTLTSPHGADVHSSLISAAQLVSSGCTKMAVLLSNPSLPPPDSTGCGTICHHLEQAALQLVAAYHHIQPDVAGKGLQAEAKTSVLNILMDVKKLVELFIRGGSSAASKLQGSGTVWESCDKMSKLSRDNRIAAGKVCLAQLRLLRDAWEEVEELQSRRGASEELGNEWGPNGGGGEEEEEIATKMARTSLEGEGEEECAGWLEADMKVIDPSTSLVQATVEFTEATCKLLVTCGGVASVAELDRVAEGVGMLSPLVDDLVSELPAPISTSRVSESALNLGRVLGHFIDTVDSCQFPHHGNHVKTPLFRDRVFGFLSELK